MDEATKPTTNFATLRNCLWVRVMRMGMSAGLPLEERERIANRAVATFGRHAEEADDLHQLRHRIAHGAIKVIAEAASKIKSPATDQPNPVRSKPIRSLA
jgi:hypothetical protein